MPSREVLGIPELMLHPCGMERSTMTRRAEESFIGLVIMGLKRGQSNGWEVNGPGVLELLCDVGRDVLQVLGGRRVVALVGSWRVRGSVADGEAELGEEVAPLSPSWDVDVVGHWLVGSSVIR